MSIPPQKSALPRRIDARKLVQREQQLDGTVPSDALPRLVSSTESIDGDVQVQLAFGRDLQRNQIASGHLEVQVHLLCQRCLQPVTERIEAEVNWGFVWTEEQGNALPKSLDPVIQEGDELDLYQVLEDEILLNLPMVAYHEVECVSRDDLQSSGKAAEAEEQRENPFKVLEQLKGSSNKS
ncbi:YceD family protein [Microbulbifer bruguierae]|uniref:Large ribosomal RNA subunit accumulation protein YceD n=1 Tax=Microbulbifer bruguierae TaxID=3029061 RepID=A0ABY8NDM2_9GAMM|nr:YceD family protein [Microbulbifer bruguierae]WGL17011.1 YceD family protein [Microbulbifer bruguierae]